MQIQSKQVAPGFVMIELSGPFDPNNIVFANARNLLNARASKETVESFDAALKSGLLFVTERKP